MLYISLNLISKHLLADETGLDEPKIDETAVDEIAVDELGQNRISTFSAHCAILLALVSAFRSLASSLTSHTLADEACKNNRKNGKLLKTRKRFFRTVHSHLVLCWTMKCAFAEHWPYWWRQASHGWGKKWSCWNRTNQTSGYGPGKAGESGSARLVQWLGIS